MKFAAAGDYLSQLNADRNDGFRAVRDWLCRSDVRFVNLETTLFRNGDPDIYGNQFSGGTYLHADPSILDDVKDYGFNILSFANNHAFDFSVNGLLSTKSAVDKAGLVNAGAGIDLEEASSPAYLETGSGKVALVSVNSSISDPVVIAGRRSEHFKGRPGINPLREDRRVRVTPQQFGTLEEIVRQSRVNAALDISRSEGYTAQGKEGELTIGNTVFTPGPEAGIISRPNEKDLNRVLKALDEAKNNADYVLVSIHAHSVCGKNKEDIAPFLVEFAHACIDRGADAVLGHGPHILRAVEIYRDRPVFYSLGDFVLQCDDVQTAPADFYEKNGVEVDSPLENLFFKRSAGGTRGLKYSRKASESVIASFEIDGGKLRDVTFLPIDMGFGDESRKGCPAPAFGSGIIGRLAELSRPFGTGIFVGEDGLGHVRLN